jgi:hypothetical protein
MRDRPDDTGRGQAVEDELHGNRGDQEAEDLLGDQHPVFVELLAHPVRPPEHHHVQINTVDLLTSFLLVHAVATPIIGVVIWLVGLGAIVLMFSKESDPFYKQQPT